MDLGAFCVCLSVADLEASRAFYASFGFATVSGDADQGWLVVKNGEHKIGLFQGLLERNTLTFNPGWDQSGETLASFTNVREIQRQLKAAGVELTAEADESGSGPAYLIATDPDGNPLFVDQHV